MSKHTPGPWIVHPRTTGKRPWAYYIGHPMETGQVSDDEAEANVYLIAAAPELLASLREARNVITLAFQNAAWNDESTDDQDSKDEVLTVLAGIEEAIKNAERGS